MRVVTPRRVVISLLLALSFVGVVAAFSMHRETPPPVVTDAAVATLYPKPGALVQRQTTIFYELDPAYDGTLSVDGHPIPDDQLDRLNVGRNRIAFTPGEGKELTRLRAGRVCAVATFHRLGETAERTVPWCFNLS